MAIETQHNRLVYRYDGETLWIEPWGTDGLRVRATKQSRMPEEDWALLPNHAADAEIVVGSGAAHITNGRITAKILDCGKLFFYNQKGDMLLEEYVRTRPCILPPWRWKPGNSSLSWGAITRSPCGSSRNPGSASTEWGSISSPISI